MENIQDIYPLSPMQEGMLFHSVFEPESEVYKEQFACELIGQINVEAFRTAWIEIIKRHDILRTAFVWENVEEPLQVVYSDIELPFVYEDVSHLTENEKRNYISKKLNDNLKDKFDFLKAPLMRITLLKLTNEKYYLLWDHHHILFDGWGLPVLLEEIMIVYEALHSEIPWSLPPAYSFKNYIAWLKNQNENDAKIFWEERLKGLTSSTTLKIPIGEKLNKGYQKINTKISSELSELINTKTREEKITINTLAQAAWAILLSYYTNNDDIVFGATVSGRNADVPGIEKMVGLFINTLPVRVKLDYQKKIVDWLHDFQIEQSDLQEYEYSPLFKIQKWSNLKNEKSLFNTILVFENYPVSETLEGSKRLIDIQNVQSFEKTNYPLTIVISPGKRLGIEIAYDTELFDEAIIDQIINRFQLIVESIIGNLNKSIDYIRYTSSEENEALILIASGELNRKVPQNNIISWFEEIVELHPDKNAIVTSDDTLTFNELNNRVNIVADILINKSISQKDIVGLSINRSSDMVVCLLAINKVGATVLPIDISYPADRINYIIEDSELSLLIGHKQNILEYEQKDLKLLSIEEINNTNGDYKVSAPSINILENSLCYIIYTSGSTGNPKGVCIQHKSFCNFINNVIIDFEITENDRFLQFSTFGFDAAIGEIYSSLLSANCLYIPERSVTLSKDVFCKYINDNNITVGFLPPSFLSIIEPENIDTDIKIISVGDKCTTALEKKWSASKIFYNGYGPTETTIGATFYKSKNNLNLLTTPIGKGFGNTNIYILDRNLNYVPIGVPGEIYVSGICVGRGYHKRPELTAEKFIPDIYAELPGKRMYKTGDNGILLKDGNILFLDRKDNQIKLRGFRIELNEIEAVLNKHILIKDSAVKAIKEKNGNEYLAAYVVPENGAVENNIIDTYLRSSLPDYMIPRALIELNELPLTPNRKVDKKQLPDPDFINESNDFIEPQTQTEELIANIWSDILKIDKVGQNDNFFFLGGHSLLATQLVSRLRESFKKDFPLNIVFETKDLKDLASKIDNEDFGKNNVIIESVKQNENNEYPLSYSQKRLWFLDKLKPNDYSYNIPTAIRIKGSIDIELINKSINLIVEKHEILRTSFIEKNGKPYQLINSNYDIEINTNELNTSTVDERLFEVKEILNQKIRAPFNLKELPLIKCELFEIDNHDYVFSILIHHIISDGWSLSILLNEFIDIYSALDKNEKPIINKLDIQYRDYANWQNSILGSENYNKLIEYWTNKLEGIPRIVELPYDKPKPSIQSNNGGQVSFSIKSDIKNKLIDINRSTNVTMFMTLLSVFNILLSKYSNMTDIVIGTPIAGRLNSQLEKLIGFFINNLALRTIVDSKETFSELLEKVRETTLEAYSNQIVPFDNIVDEIQPVRDLSHQPIFQIMFVFQNLPSVNQISKLEVSPIELDINSTNYDLTLTMSENENGISATFDYNKDIFYESTILRMVEHFNEIISKISYDPETEIGDIQLIIDSERELIFDLWNNKLQSYSQKNVISIFENISEKFSNSNAIIFKVNDETTEINYNYSELNKKANKLAHLLISKKSSSEERIAICMERHTDIVISVLAILKTGGAFLSIDPKLPVKRIKYMLEKANVSKVIVRNSSVDLLNEMDIETINIEKDEFLNSFSEENLNKLINQENLAYVIFTSGSTGLPKGVMLNHKGLVNLAEVQRNAFNINSNKRILQFSSSSFDASVWEIVMSVLNGATLYLTNNEVITSGHELSNFLVKNKISVVTLPPSVLAALPHQDMPDLDTLITAGESITNNLVKKWSLGRNYFNAYGPTETTVCASMHKYETEYPKGPPIGKAINNFDLFIIDSALQPVGIGIPGELCVGGIGLARGYINDRELTAEKFIPNEFSNISGSRLYRTGDLAKYLPDGNIEFIGRIDNQIKLRGFRIELNEIEFALKELPNILDAAVDLKKVSGNNERIVGYIIINSNEEFSKDSIIESLRDKLPEYMIPTVLVKIEEMPLTSSGKINKKLLPIPKMSREELGTEYIAPKNEVEEKIIVIVEELLNVEKVGIKDNFFELGGHSLLATQFLSRIKDQFDREIPLRKIFENPTIEGVSNALNEVDNDSETTNKVEIKKVARTSRTLKR